MRTVHITLQGKGGVGKTFVSSILAQYLAQRDAPVACVDLDPTNASFAGYKALAVQHINVLDETGKNIDPRIFDELIEAILNADDDLCFVVDTGAATFIPFCSYLLEAEVFSVLAENDCQVRLHVVVTGGAGHLDTLNGLKTIAENFPDLPLLVWTNPYYGPVEFDGKKLEETATYKKYADRFSAIIHMPSVGSKLMDDDVRQMVAGHLTFAQCQSDENFRVMTRQRLKTMWRKLTGQLDALPL